MSTHSSPRFVRRAARPEWPFYTPAESERKTLESREIGQIIKKRQEKTAAEWQDWAQQPWRAVLASDALTSPQRVTPRFRCKTPRQSPLYADKPLHVPLPAGVHHEGFQQIKFRDDARPMATSPPQPRRFPTELPSPRPLNESPRYTIKHYEHPWSWRF